MDKTMANPQAISAFFFMIDNVDDPNIELSKADVARMHSEAEVFIAASEELLSRLENETYENDIEAQVPFYDIGKKYYGEDKKQLLAFFSQIYRLLFSTKNGPRLGVFTMMFGREALIERYRGRMNNPLSLPFM